MNTPELPELSSKLKSALQSVCHEIYQNPETSFLEHKAAKVLTQFLTEYGFEVTSNYHDIETAFQAEYGNGKPVFCIMDEYDALPEIGHACGHNLIATAGIAAAVLTKAAMQQENIPGKLILMGTPAEEGQGGKIELLKKSAFENIDACILCHPYSQNGIDPGDLAVSRWEIIFKGKAAHAAAAPEEGINALDAMTLFFSGINAWRQQLPESSRVHGYISEGGTVPNIIPDYTRAFFYVRSLTNEGRSQMEKRLQNIANGAALMTGCDYEANLKTNTYDANKVNAAMDEFVAVTMNNTGLSTEKVEGRISSDYGNVSQVIPGCNLFFKVTEGKTAVPLHSKEFQKVAGTDYAFNQCLKAAHVMAATAIEYFKNPDFRKVVKYSFEAE